MAKSWYVHIGGETFGPLSTDVVQVMLRQMRLHFTDFIWGSDLTKWARISDIDEFVDLLPPYPRSPIPGAGKEKAQEIRREMPKAFREGSRSKPLEVVKSKPSKAQKPDPEYGEPQADPDYVELYDSTTDRSGQVFTTEDLKGAVGKKLARLAAYPRHVVDGKVLFESGDSFEIVDLSEGGVFLASKTPPQIGSEISFTLQAKGLEGKLKMVGVVIRHGERHDREGFAIEFMRVNPVYKRYLQNFLSVGSKAG